MERIGVQHDNIHREHIGVYRDHRVCLLRGELHRYQAAADVDLEGLKG